MPPNFNPNLVTDGFSTLDGGMDAGYDPSLLAQNQYAFGGNISIRGGLPSTRPGRLQRDLEFDSASTQTAFTGEFQGAMFYQAGDPASNSLLVWIGGRLFRIWIDNNFLVTEITPRLLVQTSGDVTLPSVGGSVQIPVNTEVPFLSGEQLLIGVSTFTITLIAPGLLTCTFNGGSTSANVLLSASVVLTEWQQAVSIPVVSTVPFTNGQNIQIAGQNFNITGIGSGALSANWVSPGVTLANGADVYNNVGSVLTTLSAQTVIPEWAATATLHVNSTGSFAPNQQITVGGSAFIVNSIGSGTITVGVAAQPVTIPQGSPVLDQNGNSITYITPIPGGTIVQQSNGDLIYETVTNNSGVDFLWLFQAENFSVTLCPGQSTVIFDGSNCYPSNIAASQLPSGWVGTYAWGRVWMAQVDEQTFIASDLVGDPSGSASDQYVDAILYVTENNLLAGGGSFKVPANLGTITAMSPLAELDTSLGIGPLLVGTTSAIFSVQAPVDRTTWQNLTYPIQSVALTGAGPVGPRNNCMANSDWWFRSLDGVRSFIAARQDFGYTDGKTPQSYEISPILAYDDPDLLLYGSQMNFDNRLYQTVSPYRTANGVAHRGLAVLNFDAVSTLNSEDPPVWESLNTGLNVLQLVYANDNGVERGFAFVVSDSGTIDLWEFSPEGDGVFTDQLETGVSATAMVAYTPIAAWLETRLMNFGDPFTQKKAITCELYLDEITDTVTVNVYLKPDQYPNWILWDTIDICATVSQCNVPPSCQVWQQAQTQYAARIMLKRPPESIPGPNATLPSNPMTGKPFDRFYELQCRLEITGHARVRKFRVQAKLEHQKMEGEAPKSAQCTLVSACPAEWFTYDAYGSQPSGPYLLDDQGNPILDDNGQPILV